MGRQLIWHYSIRSIVQWPARDELLNVEELETLTKVLRPRLQWRGRSALFIAL